MIPTTNMTWDELWRFDDERYTRAQATTDYAKLHPVIQYQFEQIGGDKCCHYKDPTDFARDLDQMSLAEWVETYVSGGRAQQARAVDRERPFRRMRGRRNAAQRPRAGAAVLA